MAGGLIDPMQRMLQETADLGRQVAERQNELAGRYDAAELFKYLMNRVDEFQNSLTDNEEIGLQLANFGKAQEIHIRSIGYKNPNLIEFSGIDLDGNSVNLIQHISQLNFMMISVKSIQEKPYRIGF